jgi:hypothetical protein
VTEFDPEASGFAKSREAYQTDHRQLRDLCATLQSQIKALEGRVVALGSQKPVAAAVSVQASLPESSLNQQTLPHTHLKAEITDLTTTFVSSVSATFDGGGSAVAAGTIGLVRIPYAGTITKASIFGDVSGSAVVDVWKDTWANYPPTVADTIAASAKPTLSSALAAEDSTLTGWTVAVDAGDVVAFSVDSCATITRLSIALEITRSL